MGFEAASTRGDALARHLSSWSDVAMASSPQDAAFRSARTLGQVLDDTPHAALLVDLTGQILWASSSTEPILRWPPDDLVGHPLSVLAVAGERHGTAARLREVLDGNPLPASAARALRLDGTVAEVSVSLRVIEDSRGAPVAVWAVFTEQPGPEGIDERLARQESFFSALSEHSTDVAAVIDTALQVVFVSASVTDLFGYAVAEVAGRDVVGLVHREDRSAFGQAVQQVMAKAGSVDSVTVRVRHKSGRWRWVQTTVANFLDIAEVGGLVLNARDVTDEVATRQQLQTAQARYRAIVAAAGEGILVASERGEAVLANDSLASILGIEPASLTGAELATLLGEQSSAQLLDHLNTAARLSRRDEVIYDHPDGRPRTLQITASALPGDNEGQLLLAMVADVTEFRRVEEELRRHSLHDTLTGLANRALLSDRLDLALRRMEGGRAHGLVAVLFFDLDDFKVINDALGHEAGDLVLRHVAERMTDGVRVGDTVARFGGDEFVVLCEEITREDALSLAEHLRSLVAKPDDIAGQRLHLDASVGVALAPAPDASTLLRAAHTALYRAKELGPGSVVTHDPDFAAAADRRLALALAVRHAIDNHDLPLRYQPIVDIETGRVVAVEALLRWTHHDLGPVSPPEIIEAAHSLGMAAALDHCVLERAIADVAGPSRDPRPRLAVSINLSTRTIESDTFDQVVADTAGRLGCPTDLITLEVTESAVMADPDAAAQTLNRLRRRGIGLAIDDFGTGYSSLAYLQRLPVQTIKIDKSFVDHVARDPQARAIAKSIIDLATSLGMDTIAEGVETSAQARVLRELGCTKAQGYLWAAALSPEHLPVQLGRHTRRPTTGPAGVEGR